MAADTVLSAGVPNGTPDEPDDEPAGVSSETPAPAPGAPADDDPAPPAPCPATKPVTGTEVVASLRDAGLSTRAIAAATGVAKATVDRDLSAGGPNGPPDEPDADEPDDEPAPDEEPAPPPPDAKPVTGTPRPWGRSASPDEKAEQKEQAWDLWLDCQDAPAIAVALGFVDDDASTDEKDNAASTVRDWVREKRKSPDLTEPPESRGAFRHLDVPPSLRCGH